MELKWLRRRVLRLRLRLSRDGTSVGQSLGHVTQSREYVGWSTRPLALSWLVGGHIELQRSVQLQQPDTDTLCR